ncbi:hypothetical protein Tco_0574292 [Tanacetum coccineum]
MVENGGELGREDSGDDCEIDGGELGGEDGGDSGEIDGGEWWRVRWRTWWRRWYYKDDSCWSADLKSKTTEDIISIGNFMEVLILNHYVLLRKIL